MIVNGGMRGRLPDPCGFMRVALSAGRIVAPPPGQAAPFDWPLVEAGSKAQRWTVARGADAAGGGAVRLRVTVGIDIRQPVVLDVCDADSHRSLGTLDLSFATALQQAEALLDPSTRPAAVLLQDRQDNRAWVLHPDVPVPAMRPHLLVGGGPGGLDSFLGHLCSPASLTQYGWMEGCVLDALADLTEQRVAGAAEALDLHLDHYFTDDGVSYEDFHSRRQTGVQGTETTNMFAGLARRRPDHPAVDQVLAFFHDRTGTDGIIRDGHVVAEHNITVAYPLAVIGLARHREELLDEALRQLLIRREHLDRPEGLYLRHMGDDRRTFRNWARGVAWYLLGMVRTLAVLEEADRDTPAMLRDDLSRLMRWLRGLQHEDGLWTCFVDEPATGPETSGSAGIAAAMQIAASRGWVGADAAASARRCVAGVSRFLSPDGLPRGMSPSNKSEAGPDVQRSGQRVLGGVATGLLGQLLAACPAAGPMVAGPTRVAHGAARPE